jgi:hypothetical protein
MSRDISPFGVRMPQDLKARIEESAAKSGRSINAEIVARLQSSFETSPDASLLSALQEQISTYKFLLRRAAGAIQMALLRGKERKIPEEDVRWLTEEYRELSALAKEENGHQK